MRVYDGAVQRDARKLGEKFPKHLTTESRREKPVRGDRRNGFVTARRYEVVGCCLVFSKKASNPPPFCLRNLVKATTRKQPDNILNAYFEGHDGAVSEFARAFGREG